MSELIRVPDIGGEGTIIELLVSVGDRIDADQSLLTLESAKASMEVPAPKAGIIRALHIKLGDTLKTGDALLELDSDEQPASAPAAAPAPAPAVVASVANPAPIVTTTAANIVETLYVPDIGGEGTIIELLVNVGDHLDADQSLLTLESAKASMEVPAPKAGILRALHVKLGDVLKPGDALMDLELEGVAAPAPVSAPVASPVAVAEKSAAPAVSVAVPAVQEHAHVAPNRAGVKVHAGPAVRLLAREFGVELAEVPATGPKGRVLKEDVQAYVKSMMQKAKAAPEPRAAGAGIPPIPVIDFSKYGDIEAVPMTRLMQIGAANLHRSWLNVPHVTQHESADITDLEDFRKGQQKVAEKAGVKLTALPFLLKACAHALKEMPDFNSSLNPDGTGLIRKKYVHIGFAVDTPEGLLVPVIRNVDQKSLLQLAAEAATLAEKARTKKLSADDMQGACFTISSLGHIGGTGFSPIVNAPEVAILGVSRASMQPVWDGSTFQPRLMLPLSLSYDHRVINGAAACRFTRRLADLLAEIRTLLL